MFYCLEGSLDAYIDNVLIALYILPYSKLSKLLGMRTVRLTCWLNMHQASTLEDVIFVSKRADAKGRKQAKSCSNLFE